MSSGNGRARVIEIGNHGFVNFTFLFDADDGTEDRVTVKMDVLKVDSFRADMSNSFADESGNIPKENLVKHREAWIEYVKEAVKKYAAEADKEKANKAAANMSDAACMAFHARITEEGERLKDFFAVASGKEESPPAPTEVKYSTS